MSGAEVVLKTARRKADGPLLARELELLRGLYPPGLVAALDLFVDCGRLVMVCAWAPGATLTAASAGSPTSAELLPAIARQLAAVLAFLHAMGIAHDDVKADNVVVDRGQATLLDLSAARRGAGLSRGHRAGETASSGVASFASDVFALAQMLVAAGASTSLREALATSLSREPRERPSARELAERLGADARSLRQATLRQPLCRPRRGAGRDG